MKKAVFHVIQRFEDWREIWRNDEGENDLKFEAYAKTNPAAARRVMRQLALLSQALFDARALEEQFGIKPDRSSRVCTSKFPPLCSFLTRTRMQKTSLNSA